MTRARLGELLSSFSSLSVGVLGDFFLDKYLQIDPGLSETSLETGLEARQVVRVRCYPGAAGTVAADLAALGVRRVFAVGFVGRDGEGHDLREALHRAGVDTSHLFTSCSLRTPTYMKPMVGTRELERLDVQNRKLPPGKLRSSILRSVARLAPELDGLMVSDQCLHAYGLLGGELRDALLRLVKQHPRLWVLVDSRARIGQFLGVCVKPNAGEAAGVLGHEVTWENAVQSAIALCRRGACCAFITLGAHGIAYAAEDGAGLARAPCAPRRVDIVGAGDAAAAGMLCTLCVGGTTQEAAEIGNLCAAVAIRKIGVTGTASPSEICSVYEASL